MSCQDWTATGRCTRVQLSTTQKDTTNEFAKVNWSDGGHVEYGNSLPTISGGCGTNASVLGSDNGFKVKIGTSPTSNCVINFNNAWKLAYAGTPYSPICVANNESSAELVRATNITATNLILTGKLAAFDKINVICIGRHDLD